MRTIVAEKGKNWASLFEPTDFFIKYGHYVSCNIIGSGEDDDVSRAWTGFVESRIRKLPTYMLEDRNLSAVSNIHLHTLQFKSSPGTLTYYIGFDVDASKIKTQDKTVYLDNVVARFMNWDLESFQGVKLGFTVEYVKWGFLPKDVFLPLGGVQAAKAMRAELAQRRMKAKLIAASSLDNKRKRDTIGSGGISAAANAGVASEPGSVNKKGRPFNESGSQYAGTQEDYAEALLSLPRLYGSNKYTSATGASLNKHYRPPVITAWNVLADPK